MLTALSSLIPFCVPAVIGLEELAEEMAHFGEKSTYPRETSVFGKIFSFTESAGR